MAALKLRIRVPVKEGGSYLVDVSICEATIQRIAEEIVSSLNRQGAQWTFSVHDPTLQQLVRQHMETGGMQRCVDAMGVPSSSLVS